MNTFETLVLKEWFGNKKAQELEANISPNIFGILKETEKAYNVLVYAGKRLFSIWAPKSCVEKGKCYNENLIYKNFNSYGEAKEAFDFMYSLYE